MVTRGRLVHAVGVGHLRRRAGLVLLWSTADFAQLSGDGKSISLERALKADLPAGPWIKAAGSRWWRPSKIASACWRLRHGVL